MKVQVRVEGRTLSVEGEDVLRWKGLVAADDRVALAREHALAYVDAHPRPEKDAQGSANIPARQRLALLRRLAAGPADRHELLEAMRDAAGWVGASDWRNRTDELRGHGKRGGGHTPLPLEEDEDGTLRLTEAFPAFSDEQRLDLSLALGALDHFGGAAAGARTTIQGIAPDVAPTSVEAGTVRYPSDTVLDRFQAAMRHGTVVRLEYRTQGQVLKVYERVLPLRYLSGDTAVRAYVAELRPDGTRLRGIQLALDRFVKVEDVPGCTPAPDAKDEPRSELVLWVTRRVLELLRSRELFELDVAGATEVAVDEGDATMWEVHGSFATELNWEVLRVLLSFTGSVRVVEPAWLGAAFVRRCVEGLLAQLSLPADTDAASYPDPRLPEAEERVEQVGRELPGPLESALELLLPPAPAPPAPGRAAKVRPPAGFGEG
ncbi:MAG: hypothetical protein ACLGIR_11235 [Actinomycetes bacterium]